MQAGCVHEGGKRARDWWMLAVVEEGAHVRRGLERGRRGGGKGRTSPRADVVGDTSCLYDHERHEVEALHDNGDDGDDSYKPHQPPRGRPFHSPPHAVCASRCMKPHG